ncbi:MAG: alpha/beta fold hydrolase [Gammaproteobacteria bacterium]|nr:alpha/beta fold hydrolase [Gammaproteobacteria bacterium]
MLRKILAIIAFLVVGAPFVLWVGATTSLDRTLAHDTATSALPTFAEQSDGLVLISTGKRIFRARVAGFGGERGNVILLHGFPETSAMWTPLIDAAADAGYRVVAFDQRGYSPGARPEETDAYAIEALAQDVLDVADVVGFDTFHLVGHDWGFGVGWNLVLTDAARLKTWTSLSIPHIASFGAAIAEDPDQQQRSSYMLLFRTPWLPEQLFAFNDFELMRSAIYAEHSETQVEEYISVFSEPGALTGALNWYRAAGFDAPGPDLNVKLPYLFIWGNRDPAVGRAAVDGQRQYLSEAFRELELDAGHWLMETHADLVVPAVLSHLATYGS